MSPCLEDSLGPCLLNHFINHFTTLCLVHQIKQERGEEREKASKTKSQSVITQSEKEHSVTFVIFYLLGQVTRSFPQSKEENYRRPWL